VVTQRVHLELPETTSRSQLFSDDWDLDSHGHVKESLLKTRRPGFIFTTRPYLSQTTHRIEEEDTLGDILFLRLKDIHLRPEYRVLNSNHYTLL
jgi:hypothetical protein